MVFLSLASRFSTHFRRKPHPPLCLPKQAVQHLGVTNRRCCVDEKCEEGAFTGALNRMALLASEGRPVFFAGACYDGEAHAAATQDGYEEDELQLNAGIDVGLRRENGGEGHSLRP